MEEQRACMVIGGNMGASNQLEPLGTDQAAPIWLQKNDSLDTKEVENFVAETVEISDIGQVFRTKLSIWETIAE